MRRFQTKSLYTHSRFISVLKNNQNQKRIVLLILPAKKIHRLRLLTMKAYIQLQQFSLCLPYRCTNILD